MNCMVATATSHVSNAVVPAYRGRRPARDELSSARTSSPPHPCCGRLTFQAIPTMSPPPPQPTDPGHDQRRQYGRVGLDSVKSSLGRVLDLSAGGMRVGCHRAATTDTAVSFTLHADDDSIALQGTIAWVRKLGFMRFEMGVQFTDLTPEISQVITRMAIDNRVSQTIVDG